ncbi:hypothetical protein [Gallaecimonas xiamenensis]|uniref:Uncharacterized protein n=1 Tax=Gallaecimonas xiamenensis 3-C-1 TaxID=745411 RepID=K2IZY7_9GAMM|nr:hypothetical protein [Gallaecimonas xiamenensis]EKE76146.1 hypothetical protein B3C1_04540 [Gallaecimonas xiamenensis 3-C-1]
MRLPAPIEVRCPHCQGQAFFEEPFEFHSARHFDASAEHRPVHRWSNWLVVERFPSHYRWKAPRSSGAYIRSGGYQEGGVPESEGGYPLMTQGLIRCPACHQQSRRRLQWPTDAYWQWQIRGQCLWAWDRQHALAILAYVQADNRPSRRGGSPVRYVPSHFLTAKIRELVVRKLTQSLG